tara:strand:+ start:3986 stop:4606 length:621 start_codon:yes stop_codon:yes gene_type:complete
MKSFVFFFIFFCIQGLSAQKKVQKTIFDTQDTAIEINANNCFLVTITTAKTNEISVEAQMDGEYSNDLLLNVHEEGKTLLVNTSFSPVFELPNDKLAAHKVLSISLKISIPENMKVQLYGTHGTVNASGTYQNISVTLNDGNCVLRNVSYKAQVTTQSGTIELYTKSGSVTAVSKYGKVISEKMAKGIQHYSLNSVTGNIHIYKTE